MKNLKRKLIHLSSLILVLLLSVSGLVLPLEVSADTTSTLDKEVSRTVTQLYNGVTNTNIKTPSDSKYGLQNFNVVEFDMAQRDLYIDVTNQNTYANQLKTVSKTVKDFKSSNEEGKTPIAAINGDLWMTAYAHARVVGSGTSYGGYSDEVVKASLTLPRGFNIYDGEIISSAYMYQETPYEGEFWSFGVTDDYKPLIGCPELGITVKDLTNGKTTAGDGLNRLPANNALVVYSDKGCLNNYALDDAYEIVIDCSYDYTINHGAVITGTVTGIYSSGIMSNPTMQNNRIILTARGSAVSKINSFALGDTIQLSFEVTEKYGKDTEGWQRVTNAVGGHMPFVVDGVKRETGTTTGYPTTIVGIKNDGSVVFITNDGRQSDFSKGLNFNMYWDFADDLDLNTAFILDGGGSTALVLLDGNDYKVANSPSDGSERTVVNSVILSYGPLRNEHGEMELKVPNPDVDLTKLYFATDEAFDLIANLSETKVEKTKDGAKLIVDKYNQGVSASFSYGLPGTSSSNANSVLSDIYPSINTAEYPYIVIDMLVNSSDPGQVQFQTLYMTAGSKKGVSIDTFIGFNNVFNNNKFAPYVINASGNIYWKGNLNTLRLGYLFAANGTTVKDGDYVIVRSIRLAKTQEEANSIAAQTTKTYTLTFNANGGTVSKSSKYVVNGTKYNTLPTPERSGFKFNGWCTSANGGDKISEDTIVSLSNDQTLYANWTPIFTDITEGAWYYNAVLYCYNNEIIRGMTDTTFEPDTSTSRAMFVTILSRLANADTSIYETSSFDDVSVGAWFAPYIEWAYQNGLASGIGGGKFGPDDKVTREQIALFMMVYANHKGYDTSARADISHYADVKSVSNWAYDAMRWAVDSGLISGTSDTTLSPLNMALRSQVAQILYRFATTLNK